MLIRKQVLELSLVFKEPNYVCVKTDFIFCKQEQSGCSRRYCDATANFPKTPSDCRAEEKQKTVTDSITELQGVVRGYGPLDPCSKSLTNAHYTFDFSQQIDCFASWVHFISWYRVDGLPRQYNYLVDESETIGIHVKLTRLISRGGRLQRGRKVSYPFQSFLFLTVCT